MITFAGLVPVPLNNEITLYWTLWASIATAIGTFLLAAFAFAAWKVARKSLSAMEKQTLKTDVRMRENRDDSRRSLEINASANYLGSIAAVNTMELRYETERIAETQPNPNTKEGMKRKSYMAYVLRYLNEMEASGAIWRMYNHRFQDHMIIFERVERALRLAHGWQVREFSVDEKKRQAQVTANTLLALALASNVRSWQAGQVIDRNASIESLKSSYRKFWDASVCRPIKFEPGLEVLPPEAMGIIDKGKHDES